LYNKLLGKSKFLWEAKYTKSHTVQGSTTVKKITKCLITETVNNSLTY